MNSSGFTIGRDTMKELVSLNKKPTESNDVVEYIGELIESVGIIHAMHLTTKSWIRHKALDEYYKDMPELIDVFVEAYISNGEFEIVPKFDIEYSGAEDVLNHLYVSGMTIHSKLSPDLTNPLEDILTKFKTVLYKLSFY